MNGEMSAIHLADIRKASLTQAPRNLVAAPRTQKKPEVPSGLMTLKLNRSCSRDLAKSRSGTRLERFSCR